MQTDIETAIARRQNKRDRWGGVRGREGKPGDGEREIERNSGRERERERETERVPEVRVATLEEFLSHPHCQSNSKKSLKHYMV